MLLGRGWDGRLAEDGGRDGAGEPGHRYYLAGHDTEKERVEADKSREGRQARAVPCPQLPAAVLVVAAVQHHRLDVLMDREVDGKQRRKGRYRSNALHVRAMDERTNIARADKSSRQNRADEGPAADGRSEVGLIYKVRDPMDRFCASSG